MKVFTATGRGELHVLAVRCAAVKHAMRSACIAAQNEIILGAVGQDEVATRERRSLSQNSRQALC